MRPSSFDVPPRLLSEEPVLAPKLTLLVRFI